MKILKKRIFALIFDGFIIGALISIFQLLVPNFADKIKLEVLLLIVLYLFKDFTFRNASIGKKIMGISIYTIRWSKPNFSQLLKRSAVMATMGNVLYWKSKRLEGNTAAIIDWERDKLKTVVIDNEVFKKLSEEAKSLNGNYADNMTKLYAKYITEIYFDDR